MIYVLLIRWFKALFDDSQLLIFCVIFTLIYSVSNAQVSISPELGLSFMPSEVRDAQGGANSGRIDVLVGVSSRVNLSDGMFLGARIFYVNRENLNWYDGDDLNINTYIKDEFTHKDVGIDLSVFRNCQNFMLGGGVSVINKFINAYEQHQGWQPQPVEFPIKKSTQMDFGLHVEVSYEVRPRWQINLNYAHILSPQEEFYDANGRSRADLTVSYDLISKD